jgi:hypothetical protein
MIRTRVTVQLATREAEVVFAQEVRAGLGELGRELTGRIRDKMREDEGREKKNVRPRITGSGYRLRLVVFGDLPQTFVDEYGRRKGTPVVRAVRMRSPRGKEFTRRVQSYTGLPPYKRGTPLYKWAERHGFFSGVGQAPLLASQARALGQLLGREGLAEFRGNQVQRNESRAFLLARKIARDGIPARRPFERTAEESQQLIRTSIDESIGKAVERLNA